MSRGLFITKPVEPAPHVDAGEPAHADHLQGEATLKRALTAKHLVMLGIGGVIGAGIFVLTGQAAAAHAGPAIILSFVIAGIACALAGLCYAEFAAMLPVSGSAYSYSYATLGEFVAWFIGWNLVLEYLFAVATVSVGWSGYFNELLQLISGWTGMPLALPDALASAPFKFVDGVPTANRHALQSAGGRHRRRGRHALLRRHHPIGFRQRHHRDDQTGRDPAVPGVRFLLHQSRQLAPVRSRE